VVPYSCQQTNKGWKTVLLECKQIDKEVLERDLPKKGMARPTSKVDTTSAVLIKTQYIWDLLWFAGINSSKLIATGVIVNAYVVLIKEKPFFLYL
jgi:hypothetical protein